MKSAQEIAAKALAQDSQGSINNVSTVYVKVDHTSRKTTDDEKLAMDKLFNILGLEYPFFIPKDDESLVQKRALWIGLLRGIDQKAREAALKATLRHYDNKGGPTVGQFVKLCRTDPAHQEFRKLLPAPPPDETKQAAEMRKMRDLLNS